MKWFKKIIITIASFLFILQALAKPLTFVVKNIKVEGLQRITLGTVLNYLPIKIGDPISSEDSAQIIHSLYATGFFQDVSLERDGNLLIIKVHERPTIGNISITGNSEITTKELNESLKSLGLVEGKLFDRALLEKVKNALLEQYHDRGKYNARISSDVTEEERNRVSISLTISEGRVATIKQIKIIGNSSFTSAELIKQFELTTHHFWSFMTKNDQYSKQKLTGSLENLRSYYMDRGYIKFKIDSAQVAITPDRRDVYLIIKITEGPKYTIKGLRLSGNLILPRDELQKQVTISNGQEFSRKAVNESNAKIARRLANEGYAFATVNALPEIDDKTNQVFLNFIIEPGQRVYVRRINFQGNVKTKDEVLRRELRQKEGSAVSVDNIDESKRRLNLLGYLDKINIQTKAVPGKDNQVDLDLSVEEQSSAQAIAGVGYSTDGFLFNIALNQSNFNGTGNSLGIGFTNTPNNQLYNIDYFNPYYTKEGIGRGFNFYYTHSTPEKIDRSRYTTNSFGGGVNYRIPVSEYDNVGVALGYESLDLHLGSDASKELIQFEHENGNLYRQINLKASWNHIGVDRAIFPTSGLNQTASALFTIPAASGGLKYYKVNYNTHWYHPLAYDFIFSAKAGLGYGGGYDGTSSLPVFKNFYAGGITGDAPVRGYDSSSLGPRDSNNDPLGGSSVVYGSLEMILPPPLSSDIIRSMLFVDGGNVFDSHINGDLRYSAGVEVQWRTPIAPLIFSLGKTLNSRGDDRIQFFQFTIATSLG